MIHVDPIEPDEDRWKEWRTAAKKATEKLIAAAARGITINERLYKQCRDLILTRFHGKCAYCESPVDADQNGGDVEHYRPKGRVTDENYKLVYVNATTAHPGYFWLAYDWRNLFPACRACNQPGTQRDGSRTGKWDRFPIKGKRATKPDDPLENEDPLLLNPYYDQPEDHLIFDADTGVISAKTERGRVTIELLGLQREGLSEIRRLIADAARNDYGRYVDALLAKNHDERERRKASVDAYDNGERPYSAFARTAIEEARSILKPATARGAVR